MNSALSLTSMLSLFAVMLVLAAIPSISVVTVCARTMSFGFIHGVLTTMGIVAGDIIFIVLAIFGLSFLFETMGQYFILIQVLGGLYLGWLGIGMIRSKAFQSADVKLKESSYISSFMAGLLITLPDQKAVLFYLGFFPAFVDVTTLSNSDIVLVVLLATLAIATAKLSYAYIAYRSRIHFSGSEKFSYINIVAGCLLLIVGMFLLVRAVF